MPAARTAGGAARATRRQAELEALHRLGCHLLAWDQPGYPPPLAEIADPPPLLTVLGDPAILSLPAVAIVGARNASAHGRMIARTLAKELAEAGLVVVSGLARGIDTAAHEGVIAAGGRTVAVIASGVDVAYPPENQGLMAEIAATGAVVSERPLGAAPQARHFPRRNRVIAGLSQGVVVVEAAPQSGSLITARLAAEQGREVMAVPGSPMDPRHRGTNRLLRDGATLVESAQDVCAACLGVARPEHAGSDRPARAYSPTRPSSRARAAPPSAPLSPEPTTRRPDRSAARTARRRAAAG